MKKFFNRFLRKDLQLNKKRWHRLIKVLFILFLIGVPIYITFCLINDSKNLYRMEYVDSVQNRIGDSVIQVGDLLNGGEHIDWQTNRNNRDETPKGKLTQYYIDFSDINRLENTIKSMYCSKQWSVEKLKNLSDKTNLQYLSLGDMRTSDLPLEQVLTEIKDYNCVLVDSMGGGEHKFLNHEFVPLNELSIVKQTTKSKWYGAWWWFRDFLGLLALMIIPGILFIVIYYKIIIYIIYGSNKKNNQHD